MKIISVTNQKGGVGKTTTTLNIGAGLVKVGKNVLLIDLDPQGNLSQYLGYQVDNLPTISELLYNEVANINLPDNFIRTNKESIDYIPTNKVLAAMVAVLGNDKDSQDVLKRLLSNDIFQKYDYIIIDCKPSLDLLVTNAFTASDSLLIPVQAELFAYQAVAEIIQTKNKIKKTSNPHLDIEGILITFFRKNTNLSKEVYAALNDSYGEFLCKIPISFSTKAGESTCASQSLVNGNSKLGLEYMQIVAEIIRKEKYNGKD